MDYAKSLQWVEEKLLWLREKRMREAEYLVQRENQPGHTPTSTDLALQSDQGQMCDLVVKLENVRKQLKEVIYSEKGGDEHGSN